MSIARTLLRPVASPATWRRWVYLVLGGAISVPYLFVAAYPLSVAASRSGAVAVSALVGTVVLVLAAIAVTSLLEAVRQVEVVAAKQLLRGPLAAHLVPVSATGVDRARAGLFFCLHLVCGGLVGAATLLLAPFGFALLLKAAGIVRLGETDLMAGSPDLLVALAGVGCLLAFVYGTAGLGTFLAWVAPSLLGRSSADRLAEMERFTDDLSERNRLARDLHDSVGHALSIVTVQAGAARRLLDQDPGFAREALVAVEEAARQALEDLDGALGVLRDEGAAGHRRTLREIGTLIRQSEAAGLVIRAELIGPIDGLPEALSRDAFLVVQESLTNALRHAGPVEVSLRVAADAETVHVEVSNPLPQVSVGSRPSGGRGVRWMSERSHARGGDSAVGVVDGSWRVHVRLPVRSGT